MKTSCGRKISNDKLHAIIVIPESWPPHAVPWLGCNTSFPNITRLHFTVPQGNDVDNVLLMGVQRNGQTDVLEARVSRLVAQKLGIEGSQPFMALTSGNFTVSKAQD